MIKTKENIPLVIEHALQRNFQELNELLFAIESLDSDEVELGKRIKDVHRNIENLRKFSNKYWHEKNSA